MELSRSSIAIHIVIVLSASDPFRTTDQDLGRPECDEGIQIEQLADSAERYRPGPPQDIHQFAHVRELLILAPFVGDEIHRASGKIGTTLHILV
jgi:hypothetical protein